MDGARKRHGAYARENIFIECIKNTYKIIIPESGGKREIRAKFAVVLMIKNRVYVKSA